jgi:glucokinase
VTASPNLVETRGLAVSDFLRSESGLPVVSENDATVACFGEATIGAARGVKNVLMATVGTGLGGGAVVEGHLVRGRYGTGGEIGHAIFMPDGEPCGCGARGCLEQYTATNALRRFYTELGGEPQVEIRMLVERAKAGEERARAVVARAGRNLGIGLASCSSLIAPEIIVIGGGISALGPLLLDPVKDAFQKHTLEYVRKGVKIVRAKLGNRAGVAGSGLMAFSHAS